MQEPAIKGDISQSAAPPVAVPPAVVPGPSVVIPNACNDACQPRCSWSVTAGAYYIKPVFESNPAYTTSALVNGVTASNRQDFSTGYEVAPLASVGFTRPNGWGGRLRWWMFDGGGSVNATTVAGQTVTPGVLGAPVLTPGADGIIDGSSNLKVSVWDVEVTHTHTNPGWNMITSVGARYASISQDYSLSVLDAAGAVVGTSSAGSNFRGLGPTFAFEGQKQIGCTCFWLYGSARGSILFGSASQSGYSIDGATVTAASSRQMDVVSIGELEFGTQFGKDFGRCRVFTQIGAVGQVWLGGGNAGQGLSPASDGGQNFGFLGGVIRVGVNF